MSLLTLRNIHLGFGGPALLEGVSLQVERGERLCLIGRNGSGKSTLMQVISGELQADEGEVVRAQGLRVTRLTQEVPAGLAGTVFDVVADGLGQVGALLGEYHRLSLRLAAEPQRLGELERVQHELEAAGGWAMRQQVETVISRLALDPEAPFDTLSGGLKRRVLLARALAGEPDLLLLDEPTNHLDIDSIAWLEEFLLGLGTTLLFVTHDRQFLQRLATRIIELDRGRLTSWPGDYATYLERKQAALEAEQREQAEFDKKLAREEVWIRQGIKARRTRNEGRVRALQAMRETRRERRERQGSARLGANSAETSGKLVIEAEHISYRYDGRPLLRDFSTLILRGDKVALLGPNGVGKTTLLRLLLGELEPEQGRVRHGTRLEVAYFDQHRAQLDEEKSVLDNVAGGRESLTINGQPRHVISYLQDFLFSPERIRQPVKALSGGERNRLLLAKLFTRPANLLVLDEPTNDLDVETLELLEELLLDFDGTLLLVSHDRAFVNHLATSCLVFEGDGVVSEYVGGYDDWLRQRPAKAPAAKTKPAEKRDETPAKPKGENRRKLGYKAQRELEALPQQIEALEDEQAMLQQRLADPALYQDEDKAAIVETQQRLEALEQELATAYTRWEELEAQG